MSNDMIWHTASELPPLHEESFEEDGKVIRSMVSDDLLMLCGGVMRVGQLDCSEHGAYWFDSYGATYNASITHWMPLPAPPEDVRHA